MFTPTGTSRRSRIHINLRSEEHTSELQSQSNLVCRLLLEKKKHALEPAMAPARTPRLADASTSLSSIRSGSGHAIRIAYSLHALRRTHFAPLRSRPARAGF